MRLRVAVVAATLVAAIGPPAQSGGEASLDLYVFSQHDEGGQRYRAEGMDYGGLRLAFRQDLDDTHRLILSVAGGWIQNDDPADLALIDADRATTTQASSDVITLDAQAALQSRLGETWTLFSGLFYHHQRRYVALGVDLAATASLAGGDTGIKLAYGFRWAIQKPRGWDGVLHPFSYAYSHTLSTTWTQILSPSWLVSAGLELTRQDGDLTDWYGYVILFDATGQPKDIRNEALPDSRNRAQLNLRARYSPSQGLSFGLDASGYLDDWGVKHVAVEPNVELPLSTHARLRLWYRLSAQSASRYYRRAPTALGTLQTQDSDLAAFTTHSPGVLLRLPLDYDADPRWLLRLSVFGLFRSDDLFAVGGAVGTEARW